MPRISLSCTSGRPSTRPSDSSLVQRNREIEKSIGDYNSASSEIDGQLRHLIEQIGDRRFSEEEYLALDVKVAELSGQEKVGRGAAAVANDRLLDIRAKRVSWDEWEIKRAEAEKKRDVASRLVASLVASPSPRTLARLHEYSQRSASRHHSMRSTRTRRANSDSPNPRPGRPW